LKTPPRFVITFSKFGESASVFLYSNSVFNRLSVSLSSGARAVKSMKKVMKNIISTTDMADHSFMQRYPGINVTFDTIQQLFIQEEIFRAA